MPQAAKAARVLRPPAVLRAPWEGKARLPGGGKVLSSKKIPSASLFLGGQILMLLVFSRLLMVAKSIIRCVKVISDPKKSTLG